MIYRYQKGIMVDSAITEARMEETALRCPLALGILTVIQAVFSSIRLGNSLNCSVNQAKLILRNPTSKHGNPLLSAD